MISSKRNDVAEAIASTTSYAIMFFFVTEAGQTHPHCPD